MRLKDQVALITGGARGIGRGISEAFAAEGAKVAVVYRGSQPAAESLVASIKEKGGQAVALQADVADYAAAEACVAKVKEQFGRMLAEGFACGVPVLTSDSGEIPHTAGDAARVLPEADVAAWTAALAELLESPDRRRELSTRGRERAVTRFAWPVVAREHLSFFESVLG